MRLFSLRAAVAAVGLAGLLLAGATACGDDDGDGTDTGAADEASATTATGSPGTGASELEGGITVLAAASLTDAFDEVGAAFTEANPGTELHRESPSESLGLGARRCCDSLHGPPPS